MKKTTVVVYNDTDVVDVGEYVEEEDIDLDIIAIKTNKTKKADAIRKTRSSGANPKTPTPKKPLSIKWKVSEGPDPAKPSHSEKASCSSSKRRKI